jgi:hypothetical protein
MDLELTSASLAIENGDLVLADGLDAIVQDVSTRLKFFLGEWFLNEKAGIDFYGKILVKNPVMPNVTATLTKVVTTTPGVKSMTKAMTWSYDGASRSMTISFQADTISGPLVYSQELVL